MLKKTQTLSFLFIMAFNYQVVASHLMGSNISYKCIGNNNYEITLNLFRDCSGINLEDTLSVRVSSVSCGQSFDVILTKQIPTIDITPICSLQLNLSSCSGGLYIGFEQNIFKGTVVLQSCDDWLFATSICCRNTLINDHTCQGTSPLYNYATLNNNLSDTTIYCNSYICNNSALVQNSPTFYGCANQSNNLSFSSYDADGDSLVYESILQIDSNGNPLPCSALPFASSGGINFNTLTGQSVFTPNGNRIDYFTIIIHEYRAGRKIASTVHEQVFYSTNCQTNIVPEVTSLYSLSGAQIVNDVIEVCPGNNVSFYFDISDDNSNNTLSVSDNASSVFNNYNINYTVNNQSNITGFFSWTPNQYDIGNKVLTVSAKDDNCLLRSLSSKSYAFKILKGVYAGVDKITCSDSVLLCTSGEGNFTWTPATGLSCLNCRNPKALPLSTTTYFIESNSLNQCRNRDTITVFADTNFSATISSNSSDTICNNIGQVQFFGNPSGGKFFGIGITDSITGIFDPQIAGIGTHEIVYIFSINNCIDNDTQSVLVTSPENFMNINDTICYNGGTYQLSMATTNSVFIGNGIVDSINGIFDPLEAGIGNHKITHAYNSFSNCQIVDTINLTVEVCLNNKHLQKEALNIYPNPSKGIFSVNFNNNFKTLLIYDVLGNLVYTEKIENITSKKIILPNKGIYKVLVNNNEKYLHKTILVN